jgi:hypothetical protein
MASDLIAAIRRLQYQMPENMDVLNVCGALLRLLAERSVTGQQHHERNVTVCPQCAEHRKQAAARQRRFRDNHPKRAA